MKAADKFPTPVLVNRRQYARIEGKFNDAVNAAFSILRKLEKEKEKS